MEQIKLSEKIQELIKISLDEMAKTGGSRELSLTITKLEEAMMWSLRTE